MSHHSLWHRPKTADGNLLTPGHKVSFSDSSKSSNKRDSGRPSTASNSRPSSPAAPPDRAAPQQRTSSSKRASSQQVWGDNRNLQRINRQSEALWQYVDLHALFTLRPLIICKILSCISNSSSAQTIPHLSRLLPTTPRAQSDSATPDTRSARSLFS